MTERRGVPHTALHSATVVFLSAVAFVVGPADAAQAEPKPVSSGAAFGGSAVIHPDLPYDKPVRDDLDEYGGWKGLQGKKTGYFHVERIGNRWWFVTPKGNVFFGLGMTMHCPRFGLSEDDWSRLQVSRLRAWGFNHTQAGNRRPKTADYGMPYTLVLHLARSAKGSIPLPPNSMFPPWTTLPDVFDPEWPKRCEEAVAKHLKPSADDPLLLGYYMDNELRFDGWYGVATRTAKDSPARRAFVEVARKYYADKPKQLAKDWGEHGVTKVDDLYAVEGAPPPVAGLKVAWNRAIAERYFSVTANACRKASPNHLNLGIRLVMTSLPTPEVFQVMGKYCDVVSMNFYHPFSDRLVTETFTLLPTIQALVKRPFMTSEFSYRGGDTPHPNTMGAPPTVPTQSYRAVGYLSYMSAFASLPFYVGTCWFCLGDQRLDVPWHHYAEDCDFGILDLHNRPHAVLTEGMRRVNGVIYALAADPVKNKSCPLFRRTELMRWDRQWDQAMFRSFGMVDLPPAPLAALLPSPRRYHSKYWVRHQSPKLTVNGTGFYGSLEANMIRQTPEGIELTLIGLRGILTLPRRYWLGPKCERPDDSMILESNAQLLSRRVSPTGQVRRLTIVDGSFIRCHHGAIDVRASGKTPYIDLVYDHDARRLMATTRGPIERLGVHDVSDWEITWNGRPARPSDPKKHPAPEGMRIVECGR